MPPRGSVAARPLAFILLTLFLLTSPAFAAPRFDEVGFGRLAILWSRLVDRVTHLWSNDLLPPPGSGGGGSGTSLDPSGLRRPVG